MEGLVSNGGGTAPNRPLISVLCNIGEIGSLPSPIFGFMQQGVDGSAPFPAFDYIVGGWSLLSPVFNLV